MLEFTQLLLALADEADIGQCGVQFGDPIISSVKALLEACQTLGGYGPGSRLGAYCGRQYESVSSRDELVHDLVMLVQHLLLLL